MRTFDPPPLIEEYLVEIGARKYDEVTSHVFGMWIDKLFTGWNPDRSYVEQKNIFLYTLRRVLDEKKAVCIPPYKYYVDGTFIVPVKSIYGRDDIWDIPNESLVAYIDESFPDEAHGGFDELLSFWYGEDCPILGWVIEDTQRIFPI